MLSKILQVGFSLKYKEGKIRYNADLESMGRGKRREEEGSLHLGAAQSPTEGLIHLPAVYHYHQRMEVVHLQPFLLDVALLKSCLRLHLAMVQKMTALGALLQDKQYLDDDEETHKTEV